MKTPSKFRTLTLPFLFLLLTTFTGARAAVAGCLIANSDGRPATPKNDALSTLLSALSQCPENVQALKALWSDHVLLHPSMVANRGFANPRFGSFSFFETVTGSPAQWQPGEVFFGHFTGAQAGTVTLDQAPSPNKLMIELIAWDRTKKLFNFYELIGQGGHAQWFYRGDSADILKDNAALYLNSPGRPPVFGNTLRCAGCHSSGGPIMKEILFPHNDWWTQSRPLTFGPNKVSPEIQKLLAQISPAEDFGQAVRKGIQLLEDSPTYRASKAAGSLKTQLRPLFCETEVNLASDVSPLTSPSTAVQVPSASLVNPLLARMALSLPKSDYARLLRDFQMSFPETTAPDADHAWLVPVKGYSDFKAIESLIKNGVVSKEFVVDVLAVDMDHPVFSPARCDLLKLIPDSGGLAGFVQNLRSSPAPAAQELLLNLTTPTRDARFHAQVALQKLQQTQAALQTAAGQRDLFRSLILSRQAVFDSVISQNPRGQIFEPGFRVIFPRPANFTFDKPALHM